MLVIESEAVKEVHRLQGRWHVELVCGAEVRSTTVALGAEDVFADSTPDNMALCPEGECSRADCPVRVTGAPAGGLINEG